MLERRAILQEEGNWLGAYTEEIEGATSEWLDEATANFSGHVFKSITDFSEFIFPGDPFDWKGAVHLLDDKFFCTNDEATKFLDVVIFRAATFHGSVDFSFVEFEKKRRTLDLLPSTNCKN